MKAKVLILDDDEINLLIYKKSLKDVELILVQSQQEALEKSAGESPDIALLDIMLESDPEGGIKTLKALKEARHQFPVIALTSFSSVYDRQHFIEVGFDGFVSKPMNQEKLEKLLEGHLG